ncbi:MAG TPA: ABC-three component system protein [Actinocrinis sp.]|nr:ABC-three component system protein [Actinocrinis sp.]
MQGAPALTPRQHLHFYSDQEWEEFTLEWVRALADPYVLVTRMGGAGDRGADVAACLTHEGTGGEWHCYQCKHYEDALRPADVWPEIVKIFLAKVQGIYELPTRYVFVAPKIGPTLVRLLANPTSLKADFFKAWAKPDSPVGATLGTDDRNAVEALAQMTSFSMFQAPDMDWILELHAGTPHHARRFPTRLKPRPAVDLPPQEQALHEAMYIQKLLAAYNQKHRLTLTTLQEAREHLKTKKHLTRQREAFYSAESLRVFARDSVPVETYSAIETDLYEAVVEVEERDYDLGYERLDAVLEAAVHHLPNPGNILAPVITVADRKGLCHHLANDDRLTWCKDDEESA